MSALRRVLLAALATLALVGCQPGDAPELPPIDVTVPTELPELPELPTELPTAAPSPTSGTMPDYDREAFDHWSDLDGDGCDTRDEILARDALGATVGDDGCVDHVVVLGPYTGQRLDGRSAIDIDHVVALSDAWRSGAWRWSDAQRERFANDPRNLLAVEDNENQSKGGDGPDEWRPPVRGFWCEYGRIYRDVSMRYELTITVPEREALDELAATC